MSRQKWNYFLFGLCFLFCPLFHIRYTSCLLTQYSRIMKHCQPATLHRNLNNNKIFHLSDFTFPSLARHPLLLSLGGDATFRSPQILAVSDKSKDFTAAINNHT